MLRQHVQHIDTSLTFLPTARRVCVAHRQLQPESAARKGVERTLIHYPKCSTADYGNTYINCARVQSSSCREDKTQEARLLKIRRSQQYVTAASLLHLGLKVWIEWRGDW